MPLGQVYVPVFLILQCLTNCCPGMSTLGKIGVSVTISRSYILAGVGVGEGVEVGGGVKLTVASWVAWASRVASAASAAATWVAKVSGVGEGVPITPGVGMATCAARVVRVASRGPVFPVA